MEQKMAKTRVLCSKEQIAARVKEMAAQIDRDYAGESIMLLGTLTGSVFFLTDLAREITVDVELDFIKAFSYQGTQSTGVVEVEYFPSGRCLAGKNIIVVEDIIDSGTTAKFLKDRLKDSNAKSVKICSLLDKPEGRKVSPLHIDYIGFTIPNEFVVGYGLDFDQKYRNLPYVGILEN